MDEHMVCRVSRQQSRLVITVPKKSNIKHKDFVKIVPLEVREKEVTA